MFEGGLFVMRILIVKTSALGDIVHCFSALRYIRSVLPDAFIGWVVEKPFEELVQAHPDVDKVYSISSKTWRKSLLSRNTWSEFHSFYRQVSEQSFDVLIDFQGNVKSGIINYLCPAVRKVGYAAAYAAEWPNTWTTNERYTPPKGNNIRSDYLFLAQKAIHGPEIGSLSIPPLALKINDGQKADNLAFLDSLPDPFQKKVLVFPGAAWQNKRVSERDLLEFLRNVEAEFGMGILLGWGTRDERACADRLQAALENARVIERLPFPQLQNLIAEMDLVIAMDSLPLHLAGTSQVPTFSFFGPSSPQKYAPEGPQNGYFQGICPFGMKFESRCPKLRSCQSGSCLRAMNVEDAFKQFKEWWSFQAASNG